MEIKAELNYLRVSPRKVRLVANLIKGMSAERAVLELRHLTKRSALPLLKLLQSALANGSHNFGLEEKGLVVKEVRVDEGPVLKRFRARAFGRSSLIHKRTSHIRILLESGDGRDTQKSTDSKPEVSLREAKPGEVKIKEESVAASKRGGAPIKEISSAVKKKKVNFVRRMFRRKAI